MKNISKLFGIIVITAIIGFGLSGCSSDDNGEEPFDIEMVLINAGTFNMGSPDTEDGRAARETQHSVTLTKNFYIGKYPVTQDEWVTVIGEGSNPSGFDGLAGKEPATGEIQGRRPVEQASFYNALVFCNKLSVLKGFNPVYKIDLSTDPDDWGPVPTGANDATWDAVEIVSGANGYRLPTEAQWEYACRAGKTTAYNDGTSDGADIGDSAWYADNSDGITREVGKKLPNNWGLHDMIGNVFEWCWDGQATNNDDYPNGATAQTDPAYTTSTARRISRGVGYDWDFSSSSGTDNLRSAYRQSTRPYYGPIEGYDDQGFRVVRIP